MIRASDKPVERWFVNGKVVGERGTVNCPTAMGDPDRKTFPQRWEEVPSFVYDPVERLKALDRDGIDGEVLFPNDPVQSSTFFQGDADFELACVQAYNDGLSEWRQVSDRYVPLAQIDQVTQENAALVEEAAAAAKSIQDQAKTLHEQVAFFTVDTDGRQNRAPRSAEERSAHDLRFGHRPAAATDADAWAEFA